MRVTYYPRNMAKDGGLKSLEVVISAHGNIKDLKDTIKAHFKNDDDMIVYE